MNLYYEIAQALVGDGGFSNQYLAEYDVESRVVLPVAPWVQYNYNLHAMQCSTRVWKEDYTGEVTFLKNRFEHDGAVPVDMKEFMWIKLRCQNI